MIFEELNGGKETNRDTRQRTRPQMWIVNFKVLRILRFGEREHSLSEKLRRRREKRERGKRVVPALSNWETMRVREWVNGRKCGIETVREGFLLVTLKIRD